MTIDNSIRLLENYLEWQKLHKLDGTGIDEATRNLIDVARKYQLMQADYESRLKADMVAMLTDIQLEIEELDLKDSVPDYQKGADETREYIADLLQQKIDALKGE